MQKVLIIALQRLINLRIAQEDIGVNFITVDVMDDTAGTAEAAPGRHWIVQDALQLSAGGPVCHFKAIWVL